MNGLLLAALSLGAALSNPERGWRFEIQVGLEAGERPDRHITDNWPVERYRTEGVTVARACCPLGRYWGEEIAQTKLDALQNDFDRTRRDGVKLLLRFAYETGEANEKCPTIEQLLAHIEQLTPIVQRNADVILALQAGWIGLRGEFQGNQYEYEKNPAVVTKVLAMTLKMLPSDRMAMMPTMRARSMALAGLCEDREVTSATAFTAAPEARIGFFNDATLADMSDSGTFADWPYAMAGNEEFDRLTRESAYLAVDGELAWNDDGTVKGRGAPILADGIRAIDRLHRHHYTTFSLVHNFSELDKTPTAGAIDAWKATPVTAEMLKAYRIAADEDYLRARPTCKAYEYIRDHLGYRLAVDAIDINGKVVGGGRVSLSAQVRNVGFARPVNPRKAFFVIVSSDGRVTDVATDFDCRELAAGKLTELGTSAKLPDALGLEPYRIGLWLPDARESLRYRTEYAIETVGTTVENIDGRRINFR